MEVGVHDAERLDFEFSTPDATGQEKFEPLLGRVIGEHDAFGDPAVHDVVQAARRVISRLPRHAKSSAENSRERRSWSQRP